MTRDSLTNSLKSEECLSFFKIYYELEWIEKSVISKNYPVLPKNNSRTIKEYSHLKPRISETERGFYDSHCWEGWDVSREVNFSIESYRLGYKEISSYFESVRLPNNLTDFCVEQLRHVELVLSQHSDLSNDLLLLNQLDDECQSAERRNTYYKSLEDFIWIKTDTFGLRDLEVIIDNLLRDLPLLYIKALEINKSNQGIKNQNLMNVGSLDSIEELSSGYQTDHMASVCNLLFSVIDKSSQQDKKRLGAVIDELFRLLNLVYMILEAQHLYLQRYKRPYYSLGYWPFSPGFPELAESSIMRVYSLVSSFYGGIASQIKSSS